jgi:hypothetical protein
MLLGSETSIEHSSFLGEHVKHSILSLAAILLFGALAQPAHAQYWVGPPFGPPSLSDVVYPGYGTKIYSMYVPGYHTATINIGNGKSKFQYIVYNNMLRAIASGTASTVQVQFTPDVNTVNTMFYYVWVTSLGPSPTPVQLRVN